MIYLEKKCNLLGMKNLFYSLMSGTIVSQVDGTNWMHFCAGIYAGFQLNYCESGVYKITAKASYNFSLNTWYHIAYVRRGSSQYLFVNGMSQPLTENTLNDLTANINGNLIVGRYSPGTNHQFDGYIDEFRISKGIARWTSNFTPPDAPYNTTTETDPTVPTSLKDGVSWDEVANIPAGFADGTDDVGIATETDPKVGSTTANSIPKWDGTTGKLVDSSSIVEDASGNVGIRTTNPEYKLHIASDVFFKQTGNSPYLHFYKYDGTNTVHIASNGDSYFNGGNVGISTTSPSQKLDVAGIVNAQGFYVNGSPFAGGGSQWTTSGSNIYYNAGNVGIGTTSPVGNIFEIRRDQDAATHMYLCNDYQSGSNAHAILGIGTDDGGGDPYIRFNIGDGRPDWGIGIDNSDGRKFKIAGGVDAFPDLSFNTVMTIDTNGNIGIGTTTPSEKLDVAGGLKLGTTSSSNAGTIRWTGSDFEGYNGSSWLSLTGGGSSQWSNITGGISYTSGKVGIGTDVPDEDFDVTLMQSSHYALKISDQTGSKYLNLSASEPKMYATGGDLSIMAHSPYQVRIGIGGVEKLVVDTNGNVGIGDSSWVPSYKLHVIGDIAHTGGCFTPSDLRLKENITPLTNAIDKVSSLRGVYFNIKGESKHQVGVIAQEVEAVLPEVVATDAQGYKSVDYSKLTPLLIEAVKELKAENEAAVRELKAENEALKAQNEDFRARIEALESR